MCLRRLLRTYAGELHEHHPQVRELHMFVPPQREAGEAQLMRREADLMQMTVETARSSADAQSALLSLMQTVSRNLDAGYTYN